MFLLPDQISLMLGDLIREQICTVGVIVFKSVDKSKDNDHEHVGYCIANDSHRVNIGDANK